MRHIFSGLAQGIASLMLISCMTPDAGATPVYLQLESRFPSGHHPREWLESRTKKVQFQRWLRVQTMTSEKLYGWLPEDHVLTSLKLATEASLIEDVPARSEPQMDSVGRRLIAKGTPVLVLEVSGSWVRALPLPASENRETWIPTESLKALKQSQTLKAFLHVPAAVYVLPGMHARILGQLEGASFVSVIKKTPSWLEIRYRGGNAFVRRTDAWLMEDLGETGLRPMIDQAPLRSAPLPYADLIKPLKLTTPLIQLATKTVRWGQVRVPETGEVWWPIAEDFDDEKESVLLSSQRIPTPDLFRRKIFDMASSPAIPSLKFASAQGVFRTIDGKDWMKIPLFQDHNFPIAITSAGAVFVGPYVSDDHGETFEQWIRWDSLVATLKSRLHTNPKALQILDIRPQDSTGRKVSLQLNVGLSKPVLVSTEDQGINWRAER